MVAGIVISSRVKELVGDAVTAGRWPGLSLNSGELKQTIQLCLNDAPKYQVREALSEFRNQNIDQVRTFLKQQVPEKWHELIDVFPIGETPIVSEINEMVDQAMRIKPLDQFERCRKQIKIVIQKCMNGESSDTVSRAFSQLRLSGGSVPIVQHFIASNTPRRYHHLFASNRSDRL